MIQMGVSRAREYQADADGAKYTHDPEALASALEKLHDGVQRAPMQATPQAQATAHLYIVNPFSRVACRSCSAPTRRSRSASSACARWLTARWSQRVRRTGRLAQPHVAGGRPGTLPGLSLFFALTE